MNLVKVLNSIEGSKDLQIEERIFNITSFNIFFFTIIGVVGNILIELNPIVTIASSLGGIISFYFYYLSRFKGYSSGKLIHYYLFAIIVLLGVMYFYNNGIGGTVVYLVFMLLNIFVLIAKKDFQYIVALVLYLLLILLIVAEYNFPHLIAPYNSVEEKVADHAITILYATIFTTFIIVKFKTKMEGDRLKIFENNRELSELNKEIYDQKAKIENKKYALEELLIEVKLRNNYIETLLGELNHRVKNNLQLVISLLDMQILDEGTQNLNSPLQETKNRLISVILAHQRLYGEDEHAVDIFMPDYIKDLTTSIQSLYSRDDKVEIFDLKIEPLYLDVKNVISIGLIINEIITNAFKHAFKDQTEPRIVIDFRYADNFTLEIFDNGCGYYEKAVKRGMGTSIISSLAKQLKGRLVKTSELGQGTNYRLDFN